MSAVVCLRRVAAADDVDVAPDRHVGHALDEIRGMFGQTLDRGFGLQLLCLAGKEHQREELREDHEIAAVFGGDLNEIFDRVVEVLGLGNRARLHLDGDDPLRRRGWSD